MNDYKNFCEYVVKPEPDAKNKLCRVLIMTALSVFTAAYILLFWVNFKSWALLILLPFILYAMFRLTWRFVDYEYEYAIEAGELTVAKIYGGVSRRTKFRAEIADMTLIAPVETEKGLSERRDIESVKDFSTEESAYVCIVSEPKTSKKRAVIIDTNEELLRILRLGNPTAFRKR